MALKKISKYSISWTASTNKGYISLYDAAGINLKTYTFTTFTELAALADILRNEKPLYWNESNQQLRSLKEEIGEEET